MQPEEPNCAKHTPFSFIEAANVHGKYLKTFQRYH